MPQDFDFASNRSLDTYDTVAGLGHAQQRFVLHSQLFWDGYQSQGAWRIDNVTQIPVMDEQHPDADVIWIDARLFSDGYLRGTVKARSGEIQSVAVDVSGALGATH